MVVAFWSLWHLGYRMRQPFAGPRDIADPNKASGSRPEEVESIVMLGMDSFQEVSVVLLHMQFHSARHSWPIVS